MARLLSRYRARSLDLEPVAASAAAGAQPERAADGVAAAVPAVPPNGNGQAPPPGATPSGTAAEQPRGAGERRA